MSGRALGDGHGIFGSAERSLKVFLGPPRRTILLMFGTRAKSAPGLPGFTRRPRTDLSRSDLPLLGHKPCHKSDGGKQEVKHGRDLSESRPRIDSPVLLLSVTAAFGIPQAKTPQEACEADPMLNSEPSGALSFPLAQEKSAPGVTWLTRQGP